MYGGKFGILRDDGETVDHDYRDIFFRQPMSFNERLVIGPSVKHVEVMLSLAQTWRTQEFYVLYVLLVSQSESEIGRYQSPIIGSFEQLRDFFQIYESFFEGDGRHHIWIGSPTNEGLIVYDQHNVLFAYGDLTRYEQLLTERGFSRRQFWFPSPHVHSFHPTNAQQEEDLLRNYHWQYFPLQEGDEWS